MRPCIDMVRMAEPEYSMTDPAPPLVPMMAIRCRARSFRSHAVAEFPFDAHRLLSFHLAGAQGLRRQHVLDFALADAVGEGAARSCGRCGYRRQTILRPVSGCGLLEGRPRGRCRSGYRPSGRTGCRIPSRCGARVSSCSRASGFLTPAMPSDWPSVGVLWSASGQREISPGRRTFRLVGLRARQTLSGGVVTSWMR